MPGEGGRGGCPGGRGGGILRFFGRARWLGRCRGRRIAHTCWLLGNAIVDADSKIPFSRTFICLGHAYPRRGGARHS
ncbi:hypothetical protein SJ05684_b45610 (plasmid) [Sinorhizobium sojae CCBAU 05684]|uniref:Uncharacterized protein n=1 Tax=Sinorhizobium sojae CCBAU 05684 TaxID=716928 RepID=A0A249PHX5_9HYPH|nr:hypothetical protein SJ05684_b45610 [Sinorhizobium sojae CCBAU 05684]